MSGSVEDEVVRMRFDTNTFQRGATTILGILDKIKNSLKLTGGGKGLDDVEAKANKFNLSGLNNAVEESGRHWSAWRTAGLIAFATVVHQAVRAGERILASFTIDPLKDGFASYQTQINAAKTIISNTGAKLPQVEAQLGQLQTYANQTVYSFSDMASNIGTFTAAGVKLVPAVSAIKGMGNTAALSGSSVQQLNTAMYQMSQAMSSGTIRLQDWNSLSNAGMGGQNIQHALMATASTIKGTGPKMDAAIKKYGNFRNSLTAGWLTGDVFSKTMGVMAGTIDKATGKTVAFSVAQLKAKGYTQAQAVQLHRLSQAAIESATQIRTYDQLTAALKEEVGTAWGAVFKTIFGNLNGATTLFTAIHTVAENALTAPIYHLNDLLKGVVKLGGKAKLLDGIKNVFHAISAIFKPIKQGFREIFPKETAASLTALITRFDNFSKHLLISGTTAKNLKRTFAGVFAIFDIGKQVVLAIFHAFGSLFGAMTHGSGGLLAFTGNIGDMLVAFDKALKKGGLLKNFFGIIANVLKVPIALFHVLAGAIGQFFSGFNSGGLGKFTGGVSNVSTVMEHLASVTQNWGTSVSKLQAKIRPAISWLTNAFGKVGHAIGNAFNSNTFGNILKTLQTGLLAGILLVLKRFMSGGLGGIHIEPSGGIFGKIKGVLDGATGSLKTMQQSLKAKILLEIAIAVGLLAASLIGLSLVDPKKLQAGMKIMAGVFIELLAAMQVLTKISGNAGFVKIPLIAVSLDLLAGAILLLTVSVLAMSRLSWSELERGLTGVGVLLAAVSAASLPLSANSAGMVRAGVGITAMAIAMNLLYIPVKLFSLMSWSAMLKGLAGVGIALGGIAIAMHLMPSGMLAQSAALLLVATAVNALYLAVRNFSGMSWAAMLKGLAGVGLGLGAIALGLQLMPPTLIPDAIALNLVALALLTVGKAVGNMAKLSWSAIARGLTALAGSLLILAGGLYLMEGAVGGAVALTVVALGLKLFVPSLVALSKLSWSAIIKGLGALALSFAAIGLAGLVLAPVVPAILGLGVALGVVGLAMLAFGAGAALLGIGLTAIAAAGGAAVAVLIGGLKGLIQLLPTLATSLATALVNFIVIIGKNAPAIIGAFVKLLTALLQAVPKIMPALITALNTLIQAILTVLTNNAPKIIQAGLTLLLDLLKGIRDNIGQVVTTVASIIVKFLNAIANNLGRIINAGVNLLFKFLEGVAKAAGRIPSEVIKLIGIFLTSLFGNLPKIVSGGIRLVGSLISGIVSAGGRLISAAAGLIGKVISGLASGAGRLLSAGARAAGSIVTGVKNGISNLLSGVYNAAYNIAKNIINGVVDGVKNLAGSVGKAVSGIGGAIKSGLGSIGDAIGLGGPSKLFMHEIGDNIPLGVAIGVKNTTPTVVDAVNNMGDHAIFAMKKTIAGLGDAVASSNLDYSPKITPVIDLTEVHKGAAKIGGILAPAAIAPKVSVGQATDISTARQTAEEAKPVPTPEPSIVNLNYTQHNTSPTPLSPVEVYRQTRNQLALAKSALEKKGS